MDIVALQQQLLSLPRCEPVASSSPGSEHRVPETTHMANVDIPHLPDAPVPFLPYHGCKSTCQEAMSMRIMLADDQLKVRFALRVLLERQPGLKVISEAMTRNELLSRLEKTCPDLLLIDWELDGATIDDLIPALRTRCPDLLIVALSGRSEVRSLAFGAGVDDFVSKVDPPEQLLAAIGNCRGKMTARAAKGGEKWSSSQIPV